MPIFEMQIRCGSF